MTLSRRRFWSYAAPAIVLAPSLMRVSAAALESLPSVVGGIRFDGTTWYLGYDTISFSQLVTTTLRAQQAEISDNVELYNALKRRMQERASQPS